MKQEFNNLLSRKKEFLARQRRCSLLIDPLKTADNPLIPESIIIEWPKVVEGIPSMNESVEIDMAPLIHRARSVIKCRTSHPTMRVKYVRNEGSILIMRESASLNKSLLPHLCRNLLHLPSLKSSSDRQAAGRMILTQREGTPATKNSDQNGATVSDGKLIASQAVSSNVTRVLLERMGERDAKTTPFKYDNRVLCATFPEMGVALNSMVDRRQLATRYAIQVEVAINIDNKLIVNHDASEMFSETSTVPWAVLRQAIQNYVKAQIVQARSLQYHEVCHIQCMILLPRVIRCKTAEELDSLERELYGNVKGSSTRSRCTEIRDRLLTEQVLAATLIERRELMVNKCFSCLDVSTELQHTVWSWLFKATEMLQDVGHKLCPSPILGEKKGSKTKKQMAACEDYQTMLQRLRTIKGDLITSPAPCAAFNEYFVTPQHPWGTKRCLFECVMKTVDFSHLSSDLKSEPFIPKGGSPSMLLRMGSLSAEHVKDFKQGLPEVLMDEQFPAKFEHLLKIDANDLDNYGSDLFLYLRKRAVFHSYETMRLDTSVHVQDNESVRVNPLTGEKILRISPPTSELVQPTPRPVPQASFVNLPSVSNALLSLLQQQMTLPTTAFTSGISSGFDIRTLLRTIKLPETAE
ncbi:hypothetical protein OSTOST_03390 [Ostertagia ostertagi]